VAFAQTKEYYTYADYLTWPDDVRYELIEGVPYMMSPAPTRAHQSVLGYIFRKIGDYLEDGKCEVFVAPFDVRLNADTEDDTVVQPDILVVCDESKIGDKAIVGAPDMVVEVLSPSTETHDRKVKYDLYENSGVKEYWIVDPRARLVETYVLVGDRYTRSAYLPAEKIPIAIFKGKLCLDLQRVFPPTT
jgi:Uma2 family endonuclease